MIIDVQTHIWSTLDQLGQEMAERIRATQADYWGQFDGSPAAHERSMGCVDAAFVLGFRSELLGARVPNEFIAEYVNKDPARRFGVAGIDPMTPDALDQVEAAVGMGLVAVTVSPACQGFHPTHSAAMRVYERCVELSIPVLVTAGGPSPSSAVLEFARPVLWDEVARSFPELVIVLGHLGHPWIDETLLLVGTHAKLYADLAGVVSRPWQLYNALQHASTFGVMDKILFASGFPYDSPEKAIESLYSVNAFSKGTNLPAISRPLLRGIVERNSLRCLGIETELTVLTASTSEAQPQRDATGEPIDGPIVEVGRADSVENA
ncbi:MAG: amidohydrolase family protein [Planctomycetota bacterium]|jgi:predicted TIM-barrel fold metal-dependent hydrolase